MDPCEPGCHSSAQASKSRFPPATRIPLADIGHALRDACRRLGRSEKTAYLYVGWARRFVMFHRHTHPADLHAQHVCAFVSAFSREPSSSATQNQALHALCFLYQHVLQAPLPLETIRSLRAKRQVRLPEPVRQTTLKRFLQQLSGTPRLVALLQLGCGLRLTEALALHVSDLHLDTKPRTLTVRGPQGRQRELPIPGDLVDLLRHHLADRSAAPPPSPDAGIDQVFISSRKRRMSGTLQVMPLQAQTIRRAFRAARPCVSPHALRQSYAIQQLDRGMHLVAVHERLGQRDIHSTLRYASVAKRGAVLVRSPADDP